MSTYEVLVDWRVGANQPARTQRKVTVDAPNRDLALLFAGMRLAQDGIPVYKPSARVLVTRLGR